MKIAVPTKANHQIDSHFGHCEFYTIFTISDRNEVLNTITYPSPQGCGCKSNIATQLAEMNVQIMLAGGIGNGAVQKLSSHGIQVIRNCKGDVHQLVLDYLQGQIQDGGSNCTAHGQNEHGAEHVCKH